MTAPAAVALPEGTTALTLDRTARYRVDRWPAVAVYVEREPVVEQAEAEWVRDCLDPDADHECTELCGYFTEPEPTVRTDQVHVVMVGDDRRHVVDVEDLRLLPEEAYCAGCGQVGCGF